MEFFLDFLPSFYFSSHVAQSLRSFNINWRVTKSTWWYPWFVPLWVSYYRGDPKANCYTCCSFAISHLWLTSHDVLITKRSTQEKFLSCDEDRKLLRVRTVLTVERRPSWRTRQNFEYAPNSLCRQTSTISQNRTRGETGEGAAVLPVLFKLDSVSHVVFQKPVLYHDQRQSWSLQKSYRQVLVIQ